MIQINRKQMAALWIGFAAIVLLLHFPPPGEGQTEWPVFIYSSHEVIDKIQPNGTIMTQSGWERPGLVEQLSLPVIVICVLTAGAFVMLSTADKINYNGDPDYLRSLRDPNADRNGNSRSHRD